MDPLEEIRKAKQVFLCGNGGSAVNALHIRNDLLACGIRVHALTADVATLTAIANDFGYEHVFSRQLQVLADEGDLLIALSGSGNSPNIVRALQFARELGMLSIAVLGDFGESRAVEWADESVRNGLTMQEAENYQLKLGHDLVLALKGMS